MNYVHIPLKYVCLIVLNKTFILTGEKHTVREHPAVAEL